MSTKFKKFSSDIDIDFANRDQILSLIQHILASMNRDGELIKHTTGIYVTDVPIDPLSGMSSIDYQIAEELGYIKLDFLNVNLYNLVRNEDHLDQLLTTEPSWEKLYDRSFCEKLIHIGNHYDTLIKMPEAVNSIPRLAMFLAIIRPAKRHLIGKPWKEVAETIWDKPTDGSYAFKKAHAISYSHLVVVNMNLNIPTNSV